MAKKKKQRVKAPAMSSLDKGIYYFLIGCSAAAAFFAAAFIIGAYRQRVFADARILAQENTGVAILFFLGMFLGGGMVAIFDWLRRKKQPIFGKANIQYGSSQWKPVYPVFSRAFWKHVFSGKKNIAKAMMTMLLIVAVVAVTLLALPPRECLFDDGSVLVYNCFNENTAEYTHSDVEEIRIYTCTFHDRGHDDWGVAMDVLMRDGERFLFTYKDFRTLDGSIRGAFRGMFQIRACFEASMVTIEGREMVPYVIEDLFLNEQEIADLHLLFDI